VERVALEATGLFPDDPYYPAMRFHALVGRDDLAAAAELWESFTEELRQLPIAAFAGDLYRFRMDPQGELPQLLAEWAEDEIGDGAMGRYVLAAERAGELDELRGRVRRWLHEPDTPVEVWYLAGHWIPEEELPRELDALLDRRPEPVPALLRLAMLDPVDERVSRVELASRVRRADHPLADLFETLYYRESLFLRPVAEWLRDLARHTSERPDHLGCRFQLASHLLEVDPVAARAVLDALDEEAQDELALARALVRAELDLVAGDLEGAEQALEQAERAGGAHDPQRLLLLMELALARDDSQAFAHHERRLNTAEDPAARAAGMVLRWSRQLAGGQAITYPQDVAGWLQTVDLAALRASTSASAQALLALEGSTDPDHARRAAGLLRPDTAPWVALLRTAAAGGDLDRAALDAIAASPNPYQWAPRLARLVTERLDARREAPAEG
jgi:hypothetical protein